MASHCLLNPTVRPGWLKPPKRLEVYPVIQLPCPEIIYLGARRSRVNKDELDHPNYRRFCASLLRPYLDMLENLSPDQIVVWGIAGSPSCACKTTSVSNGKNGHHHPPGMGVLMETLAERLEKFRVEYRDR